MADYIKKISAAQISLWQNQKPVMKWLDIELTERCNNNCIHCYINQPVDSPLKDRELSTSAIKGLIKEAASLGCLTVRFTGGEPLLREDFEELYIFTRKLGIKVILFTNATLITPNLIELFACIPPLEKIEITLYGMKKESYEAVSRVPGSFEKAWHGICLLKEKNIPFIIKGALLPPNRNEQQEFENWTKTIPWMEKPPSYAMQFDLRCRRDSEKKNRRIKALRVSGIESIRIFSSRNGYLKDKQQFCSKFMGHTGEYLFSCGSGIGGGCIDPYGKFQPCLLLRHPDTVYDLASGSMKKALTDFFPKLRSIKAENPDYLNRCARCFLKGFCEQCPAKSWMEHGTLDTPVEYFCETAHAESRYLGLLKDGEKAWEVKDWQERIKKFSEIN